MVKILLKVTLSVRHILMHFIKSKVVYWLFKMPKYLSGMWPFSHSFLNTQYGPFTRQLAHVRMHCSCNNCPDESYHFRECIVLFVSPKGLFIIRILLSHLYSAYLWEPWNFISQVHKLLGWQDRQNQEFHSRYVSKNIHLSNNNSVSN